MTERTKISSLIGEDIAVFTESPDGLRLGLISLTNTDGVIIAVIDPSDWKIYDRNGNHFEDDSYDCIE